MARKSAAGRGKRMSRNTLDALIKQKQEEHELTRYEIKKSLIRRRVMKNRPIRPPHSGTESPIAPVEQYIVSLMEQMAKLQQPLNISEGLSLANSLIEGTKWEDAVVNFKVNRGWNPIDEHGNNKPVLGKKWYKNFWKCHSHLLERKKGTSFPRTILSGQFTTTLSRCMTKYMKQWNSRRGRNVIRTNVGLQKITIN
jgi:hypothetical protein